jgi:hypothetical protein
MEKESKEKKDYVDTTVARREWYTQREWDRIVGWGTVPEEYSMLQKSNTDDTLKETP